MLDRKQVWLSVGIAAAGAAVLVAVALNASGPLPDRLGESAPASPVPRGAGNSTNVDRAALADAICWRSTTDIERANLVLDGVFHFPPHEPVELGTDLSWVEDPLADNNWQFQFHTLRWVWPLISAGAEEPRYLEEAARLAQSWTEANPWGDSEAPFAWNDHSTAWRAMVLSCLAEAVSGDMPVWLEDALGLHADALADPDFYVDHGNHALNQDTGLLAIACSTKAWGHRDLAVDRIRKIVESEVDDDGWMNEQAIEYQDYNYERYMAATEVMAACGIAEPDWFQRIESMPEVLAHAVLPDRTYATLGDTDRRTVKDFEHPAIQFTRSAGEEGKQPPDLVATFKAGFAFVRSGWGTERDFANETVVTLRFGPERHLHGHNDHGSVTMFADGQRLIEDPGKFQYGDTPERAWVISRSAHNVVTTPACEDASNAASPLSVDEPLGDAHLLQVDVSMCDRDQWIRQLVIDVAKDTMIVIDHVSWEADDGPALQRWQLEAAGEVDLDDPRDVSIEWPSGARLRMEQLDDTGEARFAEGDDEQLRGWVSTRYGELSAAPKLVYAIPPGRTTPALARIVTVLRAGEATQGGSE